ncbi:MAG: AraC-like DNA-binding protein [Phycisphaerales bacterium]
MNDSGNNQPCDASRAPREHASAPYTPVPLNPGDGTTAKLLSHFRAGRFLVTHKAYSCEFDQIWHEHPVASIDLVLAGGGSGTYSGEDLPASAGGLGFYRHETKHKFTSGPGGIRSMHLVIPSSVVFDAGVPYDLTNQTMHSAPAMKQAVALLREIHRPFDSSKGLQVESLAHGLLFEVSVHTRAERAVPWFLKVAREVLHDSVRTHHADAVSLTDLARLCDVHPGRLARTFKQHFGVTAGGYHRRLRVLRAARQLAGTNESIARVSHATGFADQAHLTRTMRAELGITPAAMKRELARRS